MNEQTKQVFCIAQEECAEVTQAISKIFRFGFDSKHPVTGKSNIESLEEEVGDLLAMVDIMVEKCIISDNNINSARKAKRTKLKQWSTIEGL